MISRLLSRTGSQGMVPAIAADEKARLRGFAMLVALGDQHAALDAWRFALDRAARHRKPLPHPAGWLRRSIVRRLDRGWRERFERLLPSAQEELDVERRATLRAFGASDAVISGLRALSVEERAAIVAQEVEHLDAADVAALLSRRQAAARRLISRSLRRYVRGADAVLAEEPWARRQATGEVARRVSAAADRATGVEVASR